MMLLFQIMYLVSLTVSYISGNGKDVHEHIFSDGEDV